MITDLRIPYKPFEYTQAHEFMKQQQRVHWLAEEIPLAQDISDFKLKLKDHEQFLIGTILKSFAQTETHVEDYWSSKVSKWFPKHEIRGMAVTFASMESTHAEAYSLLNENLGLDNFSAFLEDEESRNKLENLQVKEDTLEDKALSLAIFSAFTEGINLFSSFAVLMSFQMRNLMGGTGQIVAWSVRDESLHSTAGCWLFRQLVSENPSIFNDTFKNKIYEACRTSVKLELDFIDLAFSQGDLENLKKEELINFIKARANSKLNELGLESIYTVDSKLLSKMDWFGHLTSGLEVQDFFVRRPTNYAKSTKNWDDI